MKNLIPAFALIIAMVACNKGEEPASVNIETLSATMDDYGQMTFTGKLEGDYSSGFVYSTSPNPEVGSAEQILTYETSGETITSTGWVEPNTTYYIRAYAWETNFDVVYGNEITVETGHIVGQDYAGGVIGYFFQPGDAGYVSGEQHGLVIAKDLIGTDISWGCEGTAIPEANGMLIGTGQSNTNAIVAGCGEAGSAAVLCNDLVVDGYDDWYLPSHNEVKVIDENEAWLDVIPTGWYLTSTERTSDLAWRVYFWPEPAVTEPDGWLKSSGMNVMAVRNF